MPDRTDERPLYGDALVVPARLVFPGDPPPTDWLSRHPDACKLPVRVVWRGQSATAVPTQPIAGPVARLAPDADGPQACPVAPAAPPEIETERPDPIATFKRVSDGLDRILGRPIAEASGVAPSPAQKRTDRHAPIPVFDDNGEPVLDPDHKQIMRPDGFPDPHFFVEQGLQDRPYVQDLLEGTDESIKPVDASYVVMRLARFWQGRSWDAQRVGGSYHKEFKAYATIAIGLYSAAAGIPLEDSLAMQDQYAKYMSNFGSSPRDKKYRHLADANVKNTEKGYGLYVLKKILPTIQER